MHSNVYTHIYVCVRVVHAYTYIVHLSVSVRMGRRYACVHLCAMVMDRLCAMVMDRLCAHALAGSCCGLGLNPKP